MTDFDYNIESVRQSWAWRTARSAVLNHALSSWRKDGPAKAMERLRSLWKMRLLDLRDAGLPRSAGKDHQYLRNCPPFGVRTSVTGRCCQRALICPFC